MNIFTPERQPHENYLAYSDRRQKGNFYANIMKKGNLPTTFVQHQPNGGLKARHQRLKEQRNGNA